MSSAARLDINEQEVAQNVAHLEAATLDLTETDIVVDLTETVLVDVEVVENELLPAADSFESPMDDPAMLFVYVGTVLFIVLLALAAVLALG